MARPAPQPGVADPALVVGVFAESFQLRIGERFAADADEKDQHAQEILQPQRIGGKARRNEDRKHQRDGAERLVLQEDEHPPRRIETPFPGERSIARIVRDPGGADRDVDAEPQRPDRHQCGDQPLPRIRRAARDRPQRAGCADQAERKGPDGVDPAGIAGPLLHRPGAGHQDRERSSHQNEGRKVGQRHAKIPISPPDIEHWQNTREDNARFQLPVPLWSDSKAGIPAFSHPVSMPYWRL